MTTCTAAFGWTDPYYAPVQMLTAGHCGPQGWSWFSGSNSSFSRRVGITGWQTFNAGNTDAALITEVDGNGILQEIYNGGSSSSTFWPVGGTGFNWNGGAFCSDGSVTGENCSGIIDSCDVKADYGSAGVAYHMCSAHSSSNSRLMDHGDSGGPVVSGNMLQHGILSGGNIGNGPGQGPGNNIYFTPWIAVSNMIGGHSCPC
ncbi:trypsin-like serine protease [Streptacidiphilus sp. PAMC 29251]